MIRKTINKGLKVFGLELQKIAKQKNNTSDQVFTMSKGIERCINRGVKINTVIDIGASDGCWTIACLKNLPDASYLLIEAQAPHRNDLENLHQKNKKIEYVIAAAGNKEGHIYFENEGLFGGLASETPFEKNNIEVPLITIDAEVEKRHLPGPYLIKLDTHGYEVPILEGAKNTLSKANLVIIETYNFQITDHSLKYYEMCSYMEKIGFYPIEMVDFMLRKFDGSFWQMDTFFVKKERKEFEYNAYE